MKTPLMKIRGSNESSATLNEEFQNAVASFNGNNPANDSIQINGKIIEGYKYKKTVEEQVTSN